MNLGTIKDLLDFLCALLNVWILISQLKDIHNKKHKKKSKRSKRTKNHRKGR
ncbi:hypothetical protein [Clostridium rectalis]|uniref:hypothetical protein n=1 Tax=Clostridium rectalis TaxID=2040295 RepID=UPI0013DE3FD4|nr:hypothetical protein [Clostridium rectalis]